MNEKQHKTEFVKNYLKPLLCKAQCEVKDAEYTILDNGEEYVIITYKSGFTKRICVSADSLRAIAIDVLNHCG